MAKDLTAALQALTEQASGQTSRVDRALPSARVPPAIPPRSGSSGPITAVDNGDSFALKGEKTIASSDGLFTLYFPDTLEATIGGKVVTLGAIKTATP